MPNDEGMTNVEKAREYLIRHLGFGILSSFVFRHYLIHIAFVALIAL